MIQKKREELFRGLARRSSPVRIQIEATRKCNLSCVHCVLGCGNLDNPALDLDPGVFSRLLGEMKEAGVFLVNLTGGDIFCHPAADTLLESIFNSDFMVVIQTNAAMMKDRHFKLLKDAGNKVRCVAISLYSSTPEIHEAVTQVPGSYEKTISAIRTLVSLGIETEVSTLLMTLNFRGHMEVQSLCQEMGVRHQFYSIVLPRENGDMEPTQYRLPEEYIRSIPRPWETFASGFFDVVSPEDFEPDKNIDSWCTMGRTRGYITVTGDVLPCSIVNMPAGNIYDSSFSEIWRKSPVLEEIRQMKIGQFECSRCKHFPNCRPCPGLGMLEHGNIYSSPKEICRIAKPFLSGEDSLDEVSTAN